jgi:hypothetical protein
MFLFLIALKNILIYMLILKKNIFPKNNMLKNINKNINYNKKITKSLNKCTKSDLNKNFNKLKFNFINSKNLTNTLISKNVYKSYNSFKKKVKIRNLKVNQFNKKFNTLKLILKIKKSNKSSK